MIDTCTTARLVCSGPGSRHHPHCGETPKAKTRSATSTQSTRCCWCWCCNQSGFACLPCQLLLLSRADTQRPDASCQLRSAHCSAACNHHQQPDCQPSRCCLLSAVAMCLECTSCCSSAPAFAAIGLLAAYPDPNPLRGLAVRQPACLLLLLAKIPVVPQEPGVPLTCARTLPARAKVVNWPLYVPSSFRWPMFSCTLAWSLAVISLLVHALKKGYTDREQQAGHCSQTTTAAAAAAGADGASLGCPGKLRPPAVSQGGGCDVSATTRSPNRPRRG